MTRSQLYAAIAGKTDLKNAQVKAVFDTVYDIVLKTLLKEEKIPIGTLGFLKLVQRKARMGRNPATGEQLKIPAKSIVKFSVAAPITQAFLKIRAASGK